jgi:hypothetical protein
VRNHAITGQARRAPRRQAAQRRIRESGGELPIWGVLREDVYERRFGDGFYLHLRGLALTEADADRLAALESATELTRWHVRPYRLGLKDDAPCLLGTWREEEEFSINDFVEILAEMPPGATASMLLTGSGENGRRPGPHMLALG